jgi:tripartite-type tricarboxylate transporter receptor subunit TctC
MHRACRRFSVSLALTAVCAASAATTQAQQNYPARPIRLIVAFSAGGSLDLTARLIAQKLTERWGQSVVVDNRVGAGGIIGSDIVAKAAPDGYTLLMASSSSPVHVALRPTAPHHFGRDFAPVTLAARSAYALTAHVNVAANSVKEVIAAARAKPGMLRYGSSGAGGLPHLASELFKHMAGVDIIHIPYKGGAQALVDLVGGRLEFMVNSLPLLLPQVKAGKIKMIAVTTTQRASAVPDVPTIAESGVPGYEVTGWYGVVAPARTPSTTIAKLNDEIVRILRDPAVQQQIRKDGGEAVGTTPEQFAVVIRADIEKWTELVRRARITAD